MIKEHEARYLAEQWYGPQLAPWIRFEQADFGWIARLEEPPIGPGELVGQPVLALGPDSCDIRSYPPMSPPQIRQRHLAWLEVSKREKTNGTAPILSSDTVPADGQYTTMTADTDPTDTKDSEPDT